MKLEKLFQFCDDDEEVQTALCDVVDEVDDELLLVVGLALYSEGVLFEMSVLCEQNEALIFEVVVVTYLPQHDDDDEQNLAEDEIQYITNKLRVVSMRHDDDESDQNDVGDERQYAMLDDEEVDFHVYDEAIVTMVDELLEDEIDEVVVTYADMTQVRAEVVDDDEQ